MKCFWYNKYFCTKITREVIQRYLKIKNVKDCIDSTILEHFKRVHRKEI